MLGREDAIGHPALTDPATGLANRLHFEVVYSYLFAIADRGVPFTLMLISTSVPDDQALHVVGERIKDMTRTSDLIAHLGEGRFAALLLSSNLSGARIAADRCETALLEVATGAVSIGLAVYLPEMKEPSELIDAVDSALRKAEAAGGGLEMAG